MSEQNPREAAKEALKQSNAAARRKDLAAAERWSKTAERMALAAEKLAALPPSLDDPEEEERLREQLRVKLMRFYEAHNEVKKWEYEALEYCEALARGETREPMPLHPRGPLEEYDALERIREILAGRAERASVESPGPDWPWDENGRVRY